MPVKRGSGRNLFMPSGSRIVWRDDETLSFGNSPLVDAVDPIDGLALASGELVWRCECQAAYRESSYAFLIRQNGGACVTCSAVGKLRPQVVTTGPILWTPVDDTSTAMLQRAIVSQETESTVARRTIDLARDHANAISMAGFWLGIASFFLYVWILVPIGAVICSAIGLVIARVNGERGSVPAWIGLALGSVYTLFALSR